MNRLIPLSLAALATTLALGGTMAAAQPAPERPGMTRQAAEARAAAAFQRMDVNGDGQLDAADREAASRKWFDAADTDGDGQLSFAEVTAAQETRQAMRQERGAARADRGGERRAMGRMLAGGERRMQGRMNGGMGNGGMENGGMGQRMLASADADNDGAVSQAEFTAAALARFDALDANGDGTITADERRAQRGERRGRAQPSAQPSE